MISCFRPPPLPVRGADDAADDDAQLQATPPVVEERRGGGRRARLSDDAKTTAKQRSAARSPPGGTRVFMGANGLSRPLASNLSGGADLQHGTPGIGYILN